MRAGRKVDLPIHYRVDTEQGIVLTTFEGPISEKELQGHAERLAADPRRALPLDELVDVTQVADSDLSTEAVANLARYLRAEDRNTPGTRLAIVAASDVAFGLARLYEMHRQHPDFEIRVFRERCRALDWLRSDPERPSA